MKESDRFPTDDITWCWSDCVTDCPRQPKYIRDNTKFHSFATMIEANTLETGRNTRTDVMNGRKDDE